MFLRQPEKYLLKKICEKSGTWHYYVSRNNGVWRKVKEELIYFLKDLCIYTIDSQGLFGGLCST